MQVYCYSLDYTLPPHLLTVLSLVPLTLSRRLSLIPVSFELKHPHKFEAEGYVIMPLALPLPGLELSPDNAGLQVHPNCPRVVSKTWVWRSVLNAAMLLLGPSEACFSPSSFLSSSIVTCEHQRNPDCRGRWGLKWIGATCMHVPPLPDANNNPHEWIARTS